MSVKTLKRWLGDPTFIRKFNGWSAVIWFVAAFPICIWLASSVPFLVFVSVYAVVVSHWSTWQSARTEERQDKAADEFVDRVVERTELNENQAQ